MCLPLEQHLGNKGIRDNNVTCIHDGCRSFKRKEFAGFLPWRCPNHPLMSEDDYNEILYDPD